MSEDLEFTIRCTPPKATAQQQKTAVINGKPRRYDPANVRLAKGNMLTMLLPFAPSEPMEGPLSLSVTWTYPWRKSEPKKNRSALGRPCDTRPDCDNLLKAFCDAMTTAGFWNDDSQVFDVRFRKYWGFNSGISVKLQQVEKLNKGVI